MLSEKMKDVDPGGPLKEGGGSSGGGGGMTAEELATCKDWLKTLKKHKDAYITFVGDLVGFFVGCPLPHMKFLDWLANFHACEFVGWLHRA